MAIINKQKYLRDIYSLVGKGTVHFEESDRPRFEMGGRTVFVTDVSFDYDLCGMAYNICSETGMYLPTSHGVRPISQLDVNVLKDLSEKGVHLTSLKKERTRNLVAVESRVRNVGRSAGAGHGMSF